MMQYQGLSSVQEGQGSPTLVFLHYFGGAADSWRWVMSKLSLDYCCVALNLPGFGGMPPLPHPSIEHMTKAIAQELTKLDLGAVVLIGHSMSGKLALQVAIDHPDKVNQLILVAPSPPTQEPMSEKERKQMLSRPGLKDAKINSDSAMVKSPPMDRRMLSIETQMASDPVTWRWWVEEGTNHSIADGIAQIKVPITVIASQDDPIITYATMQQEVMSVLRQAQLITLEGVGHLIPLEAPEVLVRHIRQVVAN